MDRVDSCKVKEIKIENWNYLRRVLTLLRLQFQLSYFSLTIIYSHFVICQEKSGIEVFWRPVSNNASALVFFSRRTDMPYRYQTSLSKLNYTTGSYKVLYVFNVLHPLILHTNNSILSTYIFCADVQMIHLLP